MIKFKKFFLTLLTFIIIFSIAGTVSATDITTSDETIFAETTLEVVEDKVCNIYLGDVGRFEKKIIEFNATEKSVTLQLDFTNLKSTQTIEDDAEIFLVLDNSSSMSQGYIDGITRKQAVINSANSLVDKLFDSNSTIKVGIVGFSSLDTSKGEQEGTINDATLKLGLSNSKDEVKNAVSDIANLTEGPRTNIEAGLTIAQNNFSNETDVKRYVILLTDGVPNNATDGTFATYSGTVATRTKSKLEELENNGINVITAMINLDSERTEPTTGKTYRQLSEEIFGTEENPTTGVFYYISDEEIEETIVNDIFDSLVTLVDNTLRNITIKDYFPQEIIDNFNFEYVASPNIGTVSQTIDTTDNSITWNIELLSEGETASLSYKLTLKEDYNLEIIDRILPTNTNVDITGDYNDTTLTESSEDSPTIRVEYTPEEPIEPEDPQEPVLNTVDNTVSDDILPQTGETSIALLISIFAIIAIVAYVRIRIINKDK